MKTGRSAGSSRLSGAPHHRGDCRWDRAYRPYGHRPRQGPALFVGRAGAEDWVLVVAPRFMPDQWLVSQRVRSLGCYFPVGENRRHSRRLGWGAPVSGPQFLAFRLLRGGFLAPVSGGDFPISVSGVQRPVRQQTVLTRFSGRFWAQSLVGVFESPEFLLRHA
jgi:hypothetical protein